MRTRQSPYEIVGDGRDEGGHRYQPLDRFILQEVLSHRCRRARLWTRSDVGRERKEIDARTEFLERHVFISNSCNKVTEIDARLEGYANLE